MSAASLSTPALLLLEDGTAFEGVSVGASGCVAGEVVFNTSHSGYQEILTDPSYCRQIVTLTYPHIGNVGTNPEDAQSGRVFASGLLVRDVPPRASSWRATQELGAYLTAANTVAVAGIDTRRLTRILREGGAQRGAVVAGPEPSASEARLAIEAFPGLAGLDLAKVVSTEAPFDWTEGAWQLGQGFSPAAPPRFSVVAYDFGAKRDILRILTDLGCSVRVVPATTPAEEVLALRPDGIFLSNGPGDPEPCRYAIAAIERFLVERVPVFGICLGHQLLALASGARTEKMKFGHHGANHPVLDVAAERVMITSQNHGFCVASDGLPPTLRVTHRSLFDGSIQGIHHTEAPAFGFQGHPEASPGPRDAAPLFQHFIELMAR